MGSKGDGGPFQRFGVRGRLLLAFFGISAFAVLAAAAGMYSFSEVGKVLGRITEQRVPSALASLELSRQAERIVAAAPALLTVTTTAEHAEQSSRITGEVERLVALLTDLRGSASDAAVLEAIEPAVARLNTNLDSLDGLVADRLAISEKKKRLLQGVFATHTATQRLLAPWVLVTDSKLSQLRQLTDDPGLGAEVRVVKLTEWIQVKATGERLQKAQLEASVINDTLLQAAAAEIPDHLPVLSFRLRRRIGNLEALATDFDPKLRSLLLVRIEEFSSFAQGSDGLPAARKKEIELATAGAALLHENVELARQLTEAVDRLVGTAKGDIDMANSEALSVQRYGTGILIAVVVLSLACSILIVWLYVGRNLIRRLTGLNDSMLAIADGNLKTPLPPGGVDEIGRMAEALAVFRDTAVEVEATNLREIAEARRRLTDAIESISEGFSLYDADDRLVICNSRYHEQLYPGMSDVVKPGTSFEAVIRAAVERGLIDEVNDFESVDAWVEYRLERHRNPSGSFVQRPGKRQWVQISERRTEDGGYVAVYTDITEIKDREEELAEKSKALEQLASQLAKYLSPQVYASIFSGKQSVEIASKRKKLTVFFSDIADFTGTTDSLESEELTNLLNHYLTEMSKIAHDHGATIDKYVGDSIIAFFGDPETRGVKEDARTCVNMAIAMQRRMRELRSEWLDLGLERPFQLRIGINTGFCTVGNFGSADRMDYTIIGNEVNLAARLESLAEVGGILMAHETHALVKDTVMAEEGDTLAVKGFAKPVRTYKVAGIYDDLVEQGKIIRKEEEGIRILVDLDKRDRAEAIKAVEDLLTQLKD